MIHAFFPEKDSSIYEIAPNRNTGLDEILEIQKQPYVINTGSGCITKYYESRILMKFNNPEISTFINNNSIDINNCAFLLNLYIAAQSELPFDYTIQSYPVSGAWTNGTGRRYGQEITDGVSWSSLNGLTSSLWSTASVDTGKFWYNNNAGGANWYTTYASSSASFNYNSQADLQIDITGQIKNWINNDIPNEGLILKFESSSYINGAFPNTNISYYSSNTKTVFSPQLHVLWNTGSYTGITFSSMSFRDNPIVYIKNLKAEYKENQKHRLYIGTRPKYPRPSFTQTNEFAVNKILPKNSYYQILDAHTLDAIVPYSEYTKISGDASGSYYDFWSSPLYPERWYKFEFKVMYDDSTEYYANNDCIFKIID